MEVTPDTCAVIALANDALGKHEPEAKYLKALRDDYHRQGLITLSIGRTTFLEAIPKDATEPPHVIAEKRIAAAGLNIDRVELYRSGPSLGFRCRECGAITYDLECESAYAQRIHDVITDEKNIDFMYYQYLERRSNEQIEAVQKKWRNQKNDTLGLFEHVKWGGDIFVTSDNGFLNKRDQLASFVPGKILRPKEAIEELSKMSLPLPPKPIWQPRLEIPQCMLCRLKRLSAS